jgi:hypothetical protein
MNITLNTDNLPEDLVARLRGLSRAFYDPNTEYPTEKAAIVAYEEARMDYLFGISHFGWLAALADALVAGGYADQPSNLTKGTSR